MTLKNIQLRLGKCYKLWPRYCEPFQITKRIGITTYELNLPFQWKMHNVVHASLLRKFMFNPSQLLPKLSSAASYGRRINFGWMKTSLGGKSIVRGITMTKVRVLNKGCILHVSYMYWSIKYQNYILNVIFGIGF
jgi:hypothetical protein